MMEAILDELKIFTGNAHRGLAEEVCKYLEIPLGKAEVFKFSNDNTFVRIQENVRQRDVFIIQPTCAPVNDNLMELLIMIDACKRASAGQRWRWASKISEMEIRSGPVTKATTTPDGWETARQIAEWLAPCNEKIALLQICRAEKAYLQNAKQLRRKSKTPRKRGK